MAFEGFIPPQPTTLGLLRVNLIDTGEGEADSKDGSYNFVVLDQNGKKMQWKGSKGGLLPHLTTAQKSVISTLLDEIRALGQENLIP